MMASCQTNPLTLRLHNILLFRQHKQHIEAIAIAQRKTSRAWLLEPQVQMSEVIKV